MDDRSFILEDPQLEAAASEFLVAGAQATQAVGREGVGDRFDRFTARMADAYVRLARMLDVLPAIFVSPGGRVSLMRIEQVTLAGGRRRAVVILPGGAGAPSGAVVPLAPRAATRVSCAARWRRRLRGGRTRS